VLGETEHLSSNATHWSTRTMAAESGISDSSVLRIRRAYGLKPHLLNAFKVSNDPEFAQKLESIVGLYLNPPEHALVLCVDEKSQIQALDRTHPGLPMKRGRGETMTHDYKRNGTVTLFAALNTSNGEVLGFCMERHRHQEWLRFLRLIDQATPRNKDLYLICDNYATHKRFHVHFTPTSASWLNMVERFFRDLTQNQLKRGIFRAWKNSSWPSKATLIDITRTPSRSSGLPLLGTSWKRLPERARQLKSAKRVNALH
jgi:transposase